MWTTLLAEPTINPNFEAKQQIALHAVKGGDLECANLLLEKSASTNILNSKDLTALHIAAIKNQQEITELVLNKCKQHSDLDGHRDHNDQMTREVIQQKILQLPLCAKREINVHDLKHYLSINDETNFLKNLKLVKLEALYNATEDLLEMAVQRDFHEAVTIILEVLIRKIQTSTYPINITNIGRVAVQRGRYAILKEILSIQPEVANHLLMDICMELGKPEIDNTSDRLKCLKLILEQENVNVRCTDDKDNTPLHYAAKTGCNEAIILLLRQGSYIGHMNMFNEPPIAYISEKTLSNFFDDCVQSQHEWTNEYTIKFNYRCLMPHEIVKTVSQNFGNAFCPAAREMEVFEYIYRYSHLKHLLKHPLLSSFLYLKWHRIRYLLYANFVFYATFYIVVNAYILNTTFSNPSDENGTQVANNNCKTTSRSPLQDISHDNSILRILITVLLLLSTFREILQLIFCPRYYLADLGNCLQVVLIVLTFTLLYDARLQIGTVVILLSAWKMTLSSHHPHISIGIEIFRTVFFNFIRILMPYVLFIFAFTLAFHTLFKDNKNFSDPSHSLFKTIIMFTGEFDIDDIPFSMHPIWGRIIFILFVFLMAIVLFNLLNGLAVNNITEILKKAELVELISRIRLITNFENMIILTSYFCPPRYQRNFYNFIICRTFLFPYYLSDGKISFKPCDSQNPYSNKHYIRSDSRKHDQYWTTLRLDLNIIKKSKKIISNKNQLEDNEKIMIDLNNLKKEWKELKVKIFDLINLV